MKKQPCPKCHGYNILTGTTFLMALGLAFLIVGIIITPLIVVGAFLLVCAVAVKHLRGARVCRDCGFKW